MPEQLPIDPAMTGPQDPSAAPDMNFNPEPTPPAEPDMTEQYKANLQQMMDAVEEKYGQFNMMKFQSDNNIKAMQEDAVKQLIAFFQDNNVDPGDDKSINDFLDQVKQQDEDLYGLLENLIDLILNGVGNTPADQSVSAEQGTELASKLGGDQQPADQQGDVTKQEPIGTEQLVPPQTGGPDQFSGLAAQMPQQPPTGAPMM